MIQQVLITQGPWKIVTLGDMEYDFDSEKVYEIRGLNGETIIKTDCGMYPPNLQDARLIAAAPELLSACKDLVDNIEFHGHSCVLRALDVIAKAEGKL